MSVAFKDCEEAQEEVAAARVTHDVAPPTSREWRRDLRDILDAMESGHLQKGEEPSAQEGSEMTATAEAPTETRVFNVVDLPVVCPKNHWNCSVRDQKSQL